MLRGFLLSIAPGAPARASKPPQKVRGTPRPPFPGAVFEAFVNHAREPLLGERESVDGTCHIALSRYCIFVLTIGSTSVNFLHEVCMSESRVLDCS